MTKISELALVPLDDTTLLEVENRTVGSGGTKLSALATFVIGLLSSATGASKVGDTVNGTVASALAALRGTQTSGRVGYALYAQLAATTAAAGVLGEVPSTDTGSHTDPVVGGTVANAGIYKYVTGSLNGWQRIYDSEANVASAAAVAADSSAARAADSLSQLLSSNFSGVGATALAKIALDQIFTLQADISLLKNTATVSPAVWITGATINSEGWNMSIAMGASRTGGSLDPSKMYIRVYSLGYDENGLSIVRAHRLRLTSIERQPVTNQALKQDTVVGAVATIICTLGGMDGGVGWVYSKDKDGGVGTSGRNPELVLETGWLTVGGVASPGQTISVTNNSTEDFPLPVANWNVPPLMETGVTVRLEVMGSGAGARDSRTFAAVRYSMTGRTSGVTTASQIISAITKSTFRPAKQCPSIAFCADHDVSALTQGETADARFIAFPFRGDAPLDSATVAFPSHLPCNYPMLINRTGAVPKLYASWSVTGGNDSTGAVNADETTAHLTPFLTFQKCLYALQTAAGAVSPILLKVVCRDAGTYVLNLLSTSPSAPNVIFALDDWTITLKSWAVLRPKAGVAGIFLGPGPASSSKLPDMFCNRLPSIATGTGNGSIMIDGGELGALGVIPSKHFWWDADITGFGDASNPPFAAFGWEYITGVTAVSPGRFLAPKGTNNNNIKLARDISIDVHTGTGAAHMLNGVYAAQTNATLIGEIGTGSNAFDMDGQVSVNVVGLKCSGEAWSFTKVRTRGSVDINIALEAIQTTQPVAGINRDGNLNATKGHYIYNIGTYGTRKNYEYEDAAPLAGTGQVKKAPAFMNSIIHQLYMKSDYFALAANPTTAGQNIHTWATRYHVQFGYNTYLAGSYSNLTLGYNNELGEMLAEGERLLGLADPTALFSNYRATAALGGGGTYTPVSADLMGVARQVTPFGAFGEPRDTNLLTAARGPFEHA
jgi:hypothetical protein